MSKLAFSVYDEKTQSYGLPFFMTTSAEAIRSFATVSNDKDSMIGCYPADFTLYHVGSFDPNTSEIISITPVYLARGSELVRGESDD